MIRLFKPGDRVKQKSGGPSMIVIKYIEEAILGEIVTSNVYLKCVWYDNEEGQKTGVFHQKTLQKVFETIATPADRSTGHLNENNEKLEI